MPIANCGTKPFRGTIVPGGVYGGDGAIFAPENSIFQSENRFLAVSAPENPQDFSGNWRGVAVAGEFTPPSTSLSKRLF